MPIKMVLADDHTLFREGLANLILRDARFVIVGQAGDGIQATELVRKVMPDIVIMDSMMPNLNGIEATRQILKVSPATTVIALSMHTDKRIVKNMLIAGVKGYVLKDAAYDELIQAIDDVLAGKIYMSHQLATLLVPEYIQYIKSNELKYEEVLTGREREIIQILAEGKSVREVADLLFISPKTVHVHRQQIMKKLNLSSNADLIKYALREGLISI